MYIYSNSKVIESKKYKESESLEQTTQQTVHCAQLQRLETLASRLGCCSDFGQCTPGRDYAGGILVADSEARYSREYRPLESSVGTWRPN